MEVSKAGAVLLIPVDKIRTNPNQPRKYIDPDELSSLGESIRRNGILQPLSVRAEDGDGKYELIAGERRLRAATESGFDRVPCIVINADSTQAAVYSVIENLQRRDLNALETATAYLKLRDQFNMTLEQIGQRVGGKSVSAVSNTLRLLKLPKFTQEALFEGKLSEGQARPLIGLPEDFVESIMERIIREEWSVRRIEQAITLWKQAAKNPIENVKPAETPHAEAVEKLTSRLSTKVKIRTNARGAGQITIPFKNSKDFERIQKLIS